MSAPDKLTIDKWLPIETAPKTGVAILMCDANKIIVVGYWDEDLFMNEPIRGWKIRLTEILFNPLYWMPIPQPYNG